MHTVLIDENYNHHADMKAIREDLYGPNKVLVEDVGIGHYECGGAPGYDSKIVFSLDESGAAPISMQFPTGWTEDEMTSYLKDWVFNEFETFQFDTDDETRPGWQQLRLTGSWRATPEQIKTSGNIATCKIVWREV